jgi:predicted nucleotidyltransferase
MSALDDASLGGADLAMLDRIRQDLLQRWGDKVESLYLIGSRARGAARPDSDWDVVAVLRGQKPMVRHEGVPVGPVLKAPLKYPDGTKVDVIPLAPEERDLDHWLPRRVKDEGRCFHPHPADADVGLFVAEHRLDQLDEVGS